jgi:hypothetical protein
MNVAFGDANQHPTNSETPNGVETNLFSGTKSHLSVAFCLWLCDYLAQVAGQGGQINPN